MLLSCKTTLVLGLIQPRSRLDYLPPKARLITRSVDHPKQTRPVKLSVLRSKQVVATQNPKQEMAAQTQVNTIAKKQDVPKLIRNKEQIQTHYPDVFEGIGKFPGPPYSIQLDPSIPPKQTPCCPVPVHLKESFKQEMVKMFKSDVFVEVKDKSCNLKLCICLDPNNLNKAIIRDPYHFKTLEAIAHLIAESCIMTVCDCKKG